MSIPKLALVLVCLMCLPIGRLHSQEAPKEAKVTPLFSKDLADFPGQGRPDDHGGLSAGQHGPNPSAQRTWVHLRTGRLNRDAGERRKRSDSQAWSDFL